MQGDKEANIDCGWNAIEVLWVPFKIKVEINL